MARTASKKAASTTSATTRKKKRNGESDEAFLCGNNYFALSGTHATALDYRAATSEWSAIPAFQSIYGGELLGFALEPGADSNSQSFVAKDSVLPEPGGMWFPVYERKKFRYSDFNEDPTIDPSQKEISALWPELRPLANECVALGFEISANAPAEKYNGLTLSARQPMQDYSTQHEVKIFGSGNSMRFAYPLSIVGKSSFSISSMLNSSGYFLQRSDGSGLVSIGRQNAFDGFTADPFIQVVPYASLTEEQIQYTL